MTENTDRTIRERQARFRERSRASGLAKVTIWIPVERKPELERIVSEWKRIKQEGTTE